MTTMTDLEPSPAISQAELLAHVVAALNDGLPAPTHMYLHASLRCIDLELATVADFDEWSPRFEVRPGLGRRSQPYPLDGDYAHWTTRQDLAFRGWTVELKASEPITDEHRRHWIDSGKAAERAEYVAQKAAEQEGTNDRG